MQQLFRAATGLLLDDFNQPVQAEFIALRVVGFGHAIGIQQQDIARFQANGLGSGFEGRRHKLALGL